VAEQAERYQVVRAAVVVQAQTADGMRWLNFYKNAILPPEVPAEQIAHLLKRGLIAPVTGPAPRQAAQVRKLPASPAPRTTAKA